MVTSKILGEVMLEVLPDDIVQGLKQAQLRNLARKSRIRVQVGDDVFPVLKLWKDGFALDAADQFMAALDDPKVSRHGQIAMLDNITDPNIDLVAQIVIITAQRDKLVEMANNALYFDDSSDYQAALWDICRFGGMDDEQIGRHLIPKDSNDHH